MHHPLSISDFFPPELWSVPQPPEELFIQGSRKALGLLQRIPEQGLAIVGTRNPQARSVALVEKQIQDLAGTPLIVLSGLARGIDTAAHTAALRCGLPTIAILGTGLQFTYPQGNARLRQEILEADGLIVSEFPLSMPGLGHQFLQRNRLIAGWAKATWVVEAGKKSGALNTARWARELHRTCYSVPCFPGDPALAGNQTLLDRDHALHYWGSHSLGATWLDLAARSTPSEKQQLGLSRYHSADSLSVSSGSPGSGSPGSGSPGSSSPGSGSPGSSSPKPRHSRSLDSLITPSEIPTNTPNLSIAISRHTISSDAKIVVHQIKIWTAQKGGTQIQELLDWAIAKNWSPARFFTAYQEAVRDEKVSDRSGILIAL